MKKYKLLSTILLIALMVSVFIMPTMAISEPSPEANAVMLLDINTGNTLYSKNDDAQAYPASLTKIMTVLLAVEAIERGDVGYDEPVTASDHYKYDIIEDGSTAGIKPGETMPLGDLLYCAIIKSANEACNIIAEHISGSTADFISLMNTRAKELGCTGTSFTNTHGLPASNHYTTARDMATIALAASSHPLFMEICNTKEITIAATNKSDARKFTNSNGLISNNPDAYQGYYYEYAAGIKAGHTDAAGFCLVSTAKKNGVNLLCVVMGGKATAKAGGMSYGNFTDTIMLYDWAFENYSYRDIIKTTDLVEDVKVAMGSDADYVSVHPQTAVRALIPTDDDLQSFIQHITIYSRESGEEVTAPIEAGEVLGTISIERDGVIYGSSPLVAATSISLSYSRFIAGRIGETLKKPLVIIAIMVVLLLVAAYVVLVVRYRKSRQEYLSRQRAAGGQNIQAPQRLPKEKVKQTVTVTAAKSETAYSDVVDTEYEPLVEKKEISAKTSTERDYFEEFYGKK